MLACKCQSLKGTPRKTYLSLTVGPEYMHPGLIITGIDGINGKVAKIDGLDTSSILRLSEVLSV
jgi:hypothetical protein